MVGDWQATSIPAINPLMSIELPPDEMNGIVTPVKGIMLQEPKILRAICTVNAAHTPAAIVPWKYERGGFTRGTATRMSMAKIIIRA